MSAPGAFEHVIVYRDPAYFAAWPFNGGCWQFEDGEIVVGFVRGKCDYQSEGSISHAKVDHDGGEHVFLRSNDGGRTWPVDQMTKAYTRPELDQQMTNWKLPAKAHAPLDPRKDGYCLIAGFGVPDKTQPNKAFVLISQDRGKTWGHLSVLPVTSQFKFVAARPAYIVRQDGMLLLIGMVNFVGSETGTVRPFVFASPDGGITWHPLAEVEMTPRYPMGIMGYPLLCDDGVILLAVRRQFTTTGSFTQVYASETGGHTWELRSRVNDWGTPGDLNLLPDGRILCTYGYRIAPFGIRARISEDQGRTWGSEIVLRDDGGSYDLGYPRSIVRPDGTIVTAYYFNTKEDTTQLQGGVRHIAATLWRP